MVVVVVVLVLHTKRGRNEPAGVVFLARRDSLLKSTSTFLGVPCGRNGAVPLLVADEDVVVSRNTLDENDRREQVVDVVLLVGTCRETSSNGIQTKDVLATDLGGRLNKDILLLLCDSEE